MISVLCFVAGCIVVYFNLPTGIILLALAIYIQAVLASEN